MEPTETSPTTEQRLINLEIAASLADDLLDTLNQTVFRQQQQIDSLLRQVAALAQQQSQAQNAAGSAANNAAQELPPHY